MIWPSTLTLASTRVASRWLSGTAASAVSGGWKRESWETFPSALDSLSRSGIFCFTTDNKAMSVGHPGIRGSVNAPWHLSVLLSLQLKIDCTNHEFKVSVNNVQLLTYRHRITDLRSINTLSIYNDLSLSNVDVKFHWEWTYTGLQESKAECWILRADADLYIGFIKLQSGLCCQWFMVISGSGV